MKRIFLNKFGKNLNVFCVPVIILLVSGKCQGYKSMSLMNCSSDVAIIKTTTPNHYLQQAPISYYNNRNPDLQLKPGDSVFSNLQIEYFQIMFNTESNINVNEDTLSFLLEPGDWMRIAHTTWIFYPGRIRWPSLDVDNLMIITKSDTCIASSRKEILNLQHDKRFKNDKYYKDKVGRNTRQMRKILIK